MKSVTTTTKAKWWELTKNHLHRDNTNWKAGGLEGCVSKWKTWTFGGLHWRQKGEQGKKISWHDA